MNVFQITDFDWLFWQQIDLIFLLAIALYSGEYCGPCGLYFKSAQFLETVTWNTCSIIIKGFPLHVNACMFYIAAVSNKIESHLCMCIFYRFNGNFVFFLLSCTFLKMCIFYLFNGNFVFFLLSCTFLEIDIVLCSF